MARKWRGLRRIRRAIQRQTLDVGIPTPPEPAPANNTENIERDDSMDEQACIELDAARLHRSIKSIEEAAWNKLSPAQRIRFRAIAAECRSAIFDDHQRVYSHNSSRSGYCSTCCTEYPCEVRRFFK